jgi:hypothetical protein
LKFFDDHHVRQLQSHPLNQRSQPSTLQKYVSSIRDTGNIVGVRGAPWACYSAGGKPPFLMITYGHLTSAIYMAAESDPTNVQVRASVDAGLKGAVVFREGLAEDILL